MIEVETNANGAGCIVRVDGELTIERAAEFKAALFSALEHDGPVMVEMGGVTRVDLTCIQIVCSAFLTSYMNKEAITINRLSREVVSAVERCGLTRFPETEHKCCWLSGG